MSSRTLAEGKEKPEVMSCVTRHAQDPYVALPPMLQLELLEKYLQQLRNATNGNDIPFAPSFIGPDSYWSSAEKTFFFQSIARHSRWRPDLIAEDLGGTKSISDIWAYIQLLAESSIAHPSIMTSGSSPPSAREMSAKWIAMEERLANDIISNETQWTHHTNLKARSNSLRALKKSIIEMTGELQALETQTSFNDKKAALKRNWRKQDFLSKLNRRSLMNMNSLLRNSGDEYCSQGATSPKRDAFTSNDRSVPGNAPSIPDILDAEAVHLSPASRQRLRKRLWARRKRCIESGASPSKASKFLGRLKRGRRFSSTSQNKRSVKGALQAYGDDIQTDSEKRNKNRNVLECRGITEAFLVADGLDIFHLPKFADLSRWAVSSRKIRLTDGNTIAYDTLCYLRYSLVYFITSVIGRAIIFRRADCRQRRIIEGDTDMNQINKENVLASLSSLGQNIDPENNGYRRLDMTLQFKHDHDCEIDSGSREPKETSGLARSPSIAAGLSHLIPVDNRGVVDGDIHQQTWLRELAADEVLEKRMKSADRKYEARLWRSIGCDEGSSRFQSFREDLARNKVLTDSDGDTDMNY